MAKKKPKPGDEVVHIFEFSGMAYVGGSGNVGRAEVPFKVGGIKIPQKHLKNSNPLSLFKNHLADVILPRYIDNYKGIGKFDFTDRISPPGVRIEPSLMNRQELQEYIEEEELDIYIPMYPKNDQLREAIKEYERDPTAFVTTQTQQRERHGDEMVRKSELLAMNDVEDIKYAAIQGTLKEGVVIIETDEGPKPILKPSENPVPASDLVGTKVEPSLDETDKIDFPAQPVAPKPASKSKSKKDDLDI